jgi:hypothetical protein
MCARNYHGGLENPNLPIDEITYEDFKTIFDYEVLNQIEHIFFCGNFGDPIMSNHLIPIVEYCRDTNPQISLGIHTNGSARTLQWWKDLAAVAPKNHCVHFALDGLEDTHTLYRIGTDFNKIIANAKTFISNGGKAEWVYLSFKHNEHQIEEARAMAKDLGFEYFSLKSTSRFLEKPWFDVLDSKGNVSYKIEPPKEHQVSFIRPEVIKNYKEIIKSAEINCKIKKDKSIYVDAFKQIWPCCWVGAVPYTFSQADDLVYPYHEDQRTVIKKLIESVGGTDVIDLTKTTIKSALSNNQWQNSWSDHWQDRKLATCAKICGEFKERMLAKHDEQFIKKDLLNE